MKKTSVQSNINLETLAGGAFAEKLNETARKHPDRCHDQARSNRSNRHSNDYGHKYENRPDRDRRI